MQVTTKLASDELVTIAQRVAREAYADNLTIECEKQGPTRYRVKLGARSSRDPGTRRSASGRRGPWCCWHVFRDVFAAWLAADPDAVIRTGMATYRGVSGFLAEYPGTANANVGSLVQPAYMDELCDCEGLDDGPYVLAMSRS